jgi:hypothetical protein
VPTATSSSTTTPTSSSSTIDSTTSSNSPVVEKLNLDSGYHWKKSLFTKYPTLTSTNMADLFCFHMDVNKFLTGIVTYAFHFYFIS